MGTVMRLDELAGAKKLSDMTPEQAIEFLEKEFAAGRTTLRPIGAGSNGVALTNGQNVFKFWHRDGAYERFVKFCQREQSRFLPKFKSDVRTLPRLFSTLKSFRDDDAGVLRGVKYVKMELLAPFKGDDSFQIWNDKKILDAIGVGRKDTDPYGVLNYMGFESMFLWSGMGDTPREALVELLTHHADINDADVDLVPYMEKMNRDLIEMMGVLVRMHKFMGKDDRMDYGKRNLAMRGEQVVILDPIVDDNDLALNQAMMDFADWRLKKKGDVRPLQFL